MMLDCVPRRLAYVGMAGLLLAANLAAAHAQSLDAMVWHPDLQIWADHLFVTDHGKIAIFSGNVQLVQRDRRLNCSRLLVRYHAGANSGKNPIDRVTCDGEVIWDGSWFQLR